MSKQAVLAFREKVNVSPDVQKQIRDSAEAKNLDIVALGNAHGCEFTAEEMRTWLNEAELSDFELEMVSGGGGKPGWRPGPGTGWIGRGGGLVGNSGGSLIGNAGAGLNNASP